MVEPGAPIPWHWVEGQPSALATSPHHAPRRKTTTILHGLQDTVIKPEGGERVGFVQHVLSQDRVSYRTIAENWRSPAEQPGACGSIRRLACRK